MPLDIRLRCRTQRTVLIFFNNLRNSPSSPGDDLNPRLFQDLKRLGAAVSGDQDIRTRVGNGFAGLNARTLRKVEIL